MPRYRLRPLAGRDLEEIGRFTQSRWGRAQRRKYLESIRDRLDVLARNPELGSSREAVAPGLRCSHVGRHLIFYRTVNDGIEIVRILHDGMDVTRHLRG